MWQWSLKWHIVLCHNLWHFKLPLQSQLNCLNNFLSGGDTSTRQFIPSHPITTKVLGVTKIPTRVSTLTFNRLRKDCSLVQSKREVVQQCNLNPSVSFSFSYLRKRISQLRLKPLVQDDSFLSSTCDLCSVSENENHVSPFERILRLAGLLQLPQDEGRRMASAWITHGSSSNGSLANKWQF